MALSVGMKAEEFGRSKLSPTNSQHRRTTHSIQTNSSELITGLEPIATAVQSMM
jgi:hypothetical protein